MCNSAHVFFQIMFYYPFYGMDMTSGSENSDFKILSERLGETFLRLFWAVECVTCRSIAHILSAPRLSL